MSLSARVGALEFSGDDVRLIIVKAGGKRPQVLEMHEGRAKYTEPEQRREALAQAVRDLVAEVKKRPATYVLCVSSEFTVVRLLTIPFKGRRKVSAAVPFELERYLAFPIEELVVDYFPVLEIDNQTEVLAAGIRRDALKERLDVLALAGLETHGINIDAIGATGLWRACRGAMKGLHAVLHVRENHSALAVTFNKSLVYYRHLPLNLQDFDQNTASAAQQVQNSLRAFNANWRGGGEVLSLTVTGAGLMQEKQELLEKEIELPISYDNLFLRLKNLSGTAEKTRGNVWEPAIGAALGAAGGGFCMNFQKEAFAPKNQMAGLIPHVAGALCLLLLLFAAIVFYYHRGQIRLKEQANELNDQIAAVEQEVTGLEAQGINVDGQMFSEPLFLDILQEIAAKMPDDKATITEISVEPAAAGAPWVIVHGEVKEDAAFSAAFAELKKSTLFRVDDDPGLELAKGKSTFQIVARKNESKVQEMPQASSEKNR
jgi:hypothetical protein